MGLILMKKSEFEEDKAAKAVILEAARASLYRARWRASEQKSFMELLTIHVALTDLEVACESLENARRHLTIVEAMFKIMLESLPDARTKKTLRSSWRYNELTRLRGMMEELTQRSKKS